jgi:hypothetical protein
VERCDKIALLLKKAKSSDTLAQVDSLRAYGTAIPLTDEQYKAKWSWEAYKKENPLSTDKSPYTSGVPSGLEGVFDDQELLDMGIQGAGAQVGPDALKGLFTYEQLGLTPKPIDLSSKKEPEDKALQKADKGKALQKADKGKALQKIDSGKALQKGSKGAAVKSLQAKLLGRGYYLSAPGPGSADGNFARGTKNAILYFQVLNEIHPINGIADSRVLDKINSGNFIGPDNTKEPYPDAEKAEYTEKDVEAVARGLVVETSFRSNYREMANIIWIMVNRAKRWNMPLYKIIDPDTGGGKNWYGKLSESNRRRWKNAHRRKDFEYIKQFVRKVLDGISFKNEIGNKAHFLHPGGMPKCNGEPGSSCGKGNKRVCVDTGKWGKRCLPKWNIDGNTNMAGGVNVQTIGRARFS